MIEFAIAAVVIICAALVFFMVRRAKRQRNANPHDIYPLW